MIKNIEKNDLLFAIKKLNFADISYIIKNLQRVYDCYDKFKQPVSLCIMYVVFSVTIL